MAPRLPWGKKPNFLIPLDTAKKPKVENQTGKQQSRGIINPKRPHPNKEHTNNMEVDVRDKGKWSFRIHGLSFVYFILAFLSFIHLYGDYITMNR